MKTPFRLPGWLWLPTLVLLLASDVRAQGGEDVDVQTSGPVHEGFANPTVLEESSEPFYVDVDPPTLIDETPPQERPSGSTEWVPGYWGYDDEYRRWTWISGTWRATPPGYVWMSGYWIRTWRGWRYVRGYWAPVGYGTGEIEYLPSPPASLEYGPIGYAPWGNAIWIPGTWIWVSGGYMGWMWQSGYWLAWNPDWTWTPASFVWTPYGYIFIPGHWDHTCERRGLLYAPVCFPRNSYLSAGFSYCPGFVINVSVFVGSFFMRPACGSYYFGDFYAQSCWNRGIYPAFSVHGSKHGYDPIYAHATIQYGKGDPKWAEGGRSEYLARRDDPTKRPARTLAQQHKFPGLQIAVAAKDAGDKATTLKLERVPDADKGKLAAHAKDMRNARAERVKVEAGNGQLDAKLPDNPRKVKSKGFVPDNVAAVAVADQGRVVVPKAPEIPKNLVGLNPQPEPPKPVGKRLRDPSLDLPVRGDKVADDKPVKKPVDDTPVKKPVDDKPVKKPVDDTPVKKPVDDTPVKKPDVIRPPVRKPVDDTPVKKPVDDTPEKKPDVIRPPVRKPVDDTPVKKPVDETPEKKPDVIRPPVRKPVDDTPVKKPVDDTPEKKPDVRRPVKKPVDDTPPVKKPVVDPPPIKDPRLNPPKPGDRTRKPVEEPESQPVKKPGEKPGGKGRA